LKPDESIGRSKPVAGGAADDDECVARARGGDAEAFRVLVERYRDRVYGLALRIVRSAPDAEEVAQDAFVRAWLALPRFRGEASFSTWIYRIAARRAFDRAQTLKLRRGREAGIEAAGEAAALGDDAPRTALARQLERLVAGLPPAQRVAVTLYYLQDRSVEQVAVTLAMPENTVKTHLSRARAALRATWLARGGDEAR
jgi:RNA polymerase sigma-70 factor (ECF subfamily)